MPFGDRHLQRQANRGPMTGEHLALCFNLASNASTPSCLAPCDLRVVEVAFYARTSTAGTITVTSSVPSATIQASGSLTADTPIVVAAASLTSRTISKGSIIKVAGGGTLTDGTCVLTCRVMDFVVAAEADD